MKKFKHENRNLWLFFLIAFAWSWLFWLPEIFWGLNLYIATFGPFVAAFLLTYLNEKKDGLINLLRRGLDYRVGKIWYIPVFLLMPSIAGFSLLGAILSGDTIPELKVLSHPWLILVNFIYILFLGGPLQEEFGWRGYALHRLQVHHNALISSVIIGVIWAFWHLPLNFMSNKAGPQYEAVLSIFIGSVITMVFMSILFTWLFNNTRGSIFIALLFHTMTNLSTYVIFPVFETKIGPLYYMVSIIFVDIIILIIYGPKKMVREMRTKTNL
ncbi:MAG: type II CAAX endopeptidase family protein, partial [Candidatus Thermoplasmatota archaeon]